MREPENPSAIVRTSSGSDAQLADVRPDLADEADAFAEKSLAANTRKALRMDWAVFTAFCQANGFQPLPANLGAVAGFFAEQSKLKKVATLVRYRATISKMHKLAGHPSPFTDARVLAVLTGIKREKGVAQTRKAPITHELAAAIESVRDRAIVLLGLMTSFRGEELCALDVEDLTISDQGIVVNLKKSKTDQYRAGRRVAVPRYVDDPEGCPTRAVEAWLEVLGETTGPLFRGFLCNGKPRSAEHRMVPSTISQIVKSAVATAGLDRTKYGAHSMRSGYVTKAREEGFDWLTIMEQTGHKRLETVKRYDRGTIDPFKSSKVTEVFARRKSK